MRCGWIGAACLAASAVVYAQEPAVQTSPAAPAGPTAAVPGISTPAVSEAPASVPPASAPPAARGRRAHRAHRARAPRSLPSTPSPITDHFALRGIYFMGHVGTHAQFDSGAGVPGTPFSAEQTAGLSDRTNQARMELIFRMEQRSRLRVNFIDLRRQGDAVLSAPLQYGDQLFRAGSLLQSEVDWQQTDFTYTYSFLRTDRYELGAGAAVHLIQAQATAAVPNSPQRAVYSEAGPFVTLAVDGTVRLARYWDLSARGQYLKLTINNNIGSLADYHADLQYRWRANFAVGVGYEYERVEVDLLHTDPAGFVQLNISGPELFARLSF